MTSSYLAFTLLLAALILGAALGILFTRAWHIAVLRALTAELRATARMWQEDSKCR